MKDDRLQAALKEFDKSSTQERRAAADIRKNAVGLLTPALMRKHLKSGQDLVLAYGRSGATVVYSADDLRKFASAIEGANKKFTGHTAGVPLLALEQASTAADKMRAKNVRAATLYKVDKNLLLFQVPGNSKAHYQVRIRLEDWGRAISSPYADALGAARAAATGRLSIDCDCGRHQYWFRYLSTIGGYAVTPPREQDYPKIRNPALKGCCCKHVLKVLRVLKSHTVHRVLSKELERQSQAVGFADNVKARFLANAEVRAASLARGVTRSPKEARASFKRFQREAAEFIESARSRADVRAKMAELKPRRRPAPAPMPRPSEAAATPLVGVIRDVLKVARSLDMPPDELLGKVANTHGVSREQIDAIIREEKL